MVNPTRDRILDAALECFLHEGYEKATVARIRERSGVSNGTLFHHFPTKEAVADALYVEAMASFQQGLWDVVRRRPRSLRAAVGAVIEHQLEWIEAHRDQARWVYERGHLELDSPSRVQLDELNRSLAGAFGDWIGSLVQAGRMRPLPFLVVNAIVTGPAHAIARRWLSEGLDRALRAYAPELTDAACAALAGTAPRRGRRSSPAPRASRIRVEILDETGSVLAAGESVTALDATGG